MKVLFSIYPSNRWVAGGKERQIQEIYDELKKLDIDITLHNPWNWNDIKQYDILHLFGSEYYQYEMAARAKARGIQVVVSSILVYANQRTELLMKLWRHIDWTIPISTTFRLRRNLLQNADRVVCMSEHEKQSAQQIYGVKFNNIVKIPLTVSPLFAEATSDLFIHHTGIRDFILSVGRIEPRKNVLSIIEAMKPLRLPLVIIGGFDPSYPEYCGSVKQAIETYDWITHIPALAPSDPLLHSAYATARVHALVSHYEMVGLVVLEAALAGTNIVTSQLPSTYEYLQNYAWYANPKDIFSIRQQIQTAYITPFNPKVQQHILDRYSTSAVAQQLHHMYQKLGS